MRDFAARETARFGRPPSRPGWTGVRQVAHCEPPRTSRRVAADASAAAHPLMTVVVIYFYAMIGMTFADRLDPSDETVALTGYAQAGYARCRRGDRADDWDACDDDGHGRFRRELRNGSTSTIHLGIDRTIYALLNLNNWHGPRGGPLPPGPNDHTRRWAARRAGVTLYFASFVLICFILLMNDGGPSGAPARPRRWPHADKATRRRRCARARERKAQESASQSVGRRHGGERGDGDCRDSGARLVRALLQSPCARAVCAADSAARTRRRRRGSTRAEHRSTPAADPRCGLQLSRARVRGARLAEAGGDRTAPLRPIRAQDDVGLVGERCRPRRGTVASSMPPTCLQRQRLERSPMAR